MSNLKHESSKPEIAYGSQGRAQAILSPWRFGGWVARLIKRSCSGGMWTISRDGKLMCESLGYDPCQPD